MTDITIKGDGRERKFIYDPEGRIIKQLDNDVEMRHYGYDAYGRNTVLAGVDDCILEGYHYDQKGRLIRVEDALKNATLIDYDDAGRRVGITSPCGNSQHVGYTPWDAMSFLADDKGVTVFENDAWGRVTSITKADGTTEKYSYDPSGHMLGSTDGNGHVITYEYDGFGRMIRREDALGESDCYEYDCVGNLIRHTDRNQNTIRMRYNMYGDMVERAEITDDESHTPLREVYGYDAFGDLSFGIASGMRYDYRRDILGRILEKSASGRSLVSYSYDHLGRLSGRRDITGKETAFEYDLTGKLSRVTDNGKIVAEYSYDPAGRKISEQLGEHIFKNFNYNADGLISSLRAELDSKPVLDNRYDYDCMGNLIRKDTLNGSFGYEYNAVNMLTSVTKTGLNPKDNYTESFNYDPAGNRIKRSYREDGMELVESYSYDAGNRLTQMEILGAFPETRHFTYDHQGNMLSDGRNSYDYDAFNRLKQVSNDTGIIQRNHYDAEGLRAELEENGKLVRFIYSDKEAITEEGSDGNIIRYIRGLDLIASDNEKARTYYHLSDASSYFITDEQGSITDLVYEDKLINHYEYDAFGNARTCDETIPNR